MRDLSDLLLEKCLIEGEDIPLKSGKFTDIKFDLDKASDRLANRAAVALGTLAAERFTGFDTLVTIGNGANRLGFRAARKASRTLGQPVKHLETYKKKDDSFAASRGNIHLHRINAVLVDDVFTEGTSAKMVSELVSVWGGKIVGEVVILNRNEDLLTTFEVPGYDEELRVESLIIQPLPTKAA